MKNAALALALTLSAVAAQDFVQTEWQPCSFSDDASRNGTNPIYLENENVNDFECANVTVPLCHEGICQSDKTIELFVKRKVATQQPVDDQPQQSIYVLHGDSIAAMEPTMTAIYYTMQSTSNVYAMDHRGTGLSTRLNCDNLDQNTIMTPELFADCIKQTLPLIDNNPVAFSATSAAKDLEYVIANVNAGEETYVYGGSYGSYWVERLMHLKPETVKGYVLDGVISEEGVDDFSKYSFAYWSRNRLPPAQRFFDYCVNSTVCPLTFDEASTESPHTQILAQVKAQDESPNTCFQGLSQLAVSDPFSTAMKPSDMLRILMDKLLTDGFREGIPYCLELFLTCDDQAPKEIERIMKAMFPQLNAALEEQLPPLDAQVVAAEETNAGGNKLLHYLIGFSEIWSAPTPSFETSDEAYEANLLGANTTSDSVLACVFLGDDEKPDFCGDVGAPVDQSFQYKTDEYFNVTASVPEGAGVLFLNGKLDFTTPIEFGAVEYDKMEGDNKISVAFDYGAHGVATTLDTQDCAVNIIANFMKARADTTQVDISCAPKAPAIDWTAPAFLTWVNATLPTNDSTDENEALLKHKSHHKSHIHIRIKALQQQQKVHPSKHFKKHGKKHN